MAQFSFIYGIKKAGLWTFFSALKCLKTFDLYEASKRPDFGRFFGLEMSKNLCFICGIKKAGLWTFFCLEMSENICFIFGIKKAGLWAYF